MTLYRILMTVNGLVHAGMIFWVVFRPAFFDYPEYANRIPTVLRRILRMQNEFIVLFLAGFSIACLSAAGSSEMGVGLSLLLMLFWLPRLACMLIAGTQTSSDARSRARAVTA